MITERKKPTCSNCGTQLPHPKDPPIPTPEGYSMMEELRRIGAGGWVAQITERAAAMIKPKRRRR